MTAPLVHLETLLAPSLYGREQIALALQIAAVLKRGKLVLVEEPKR